MFRSQASNYIKQQLSNLEQHLQEENPILVDVVRSFRRLDRVGYRMGLLDRDESYAMFIPWWPLISVLGTFSAGKSSFINQYLQYPVQRTGTQAVDDKFSVLCYAGDEQVRELPGISLNSDARFPFYQMSEELDKVAPGEGELLDSYLRLKTCPAPELRGQILIDSPGFDADAQRTSTLRITDYIIDLSDLVLVFFDARHPEPGAMQDTLSHLVANTNSRSDSSKFLYILNQIDTAAAEDNPEDVVSSWQRALAQEGLTAGRFYTIYNPDSAVTIEDEAKKRRFESKRDADLQEIHQRMRRVGVERAYRIIGDLERTAREIEEERVPQLRRALKRWVQGVWVTDGLLLLTALVLLGGGSAWMGYWNGLQFQPPEWLAAVFGSAVGAISASVVIVGGLLWAHFGVRRWMAGRVTRWIEATYPTSPVQEQLKRAFARSTRPWRSALTTSPAGWGRPARKRLKGLIETADGYVQRLNDRFASPSGEGQGAPAPGTSPSGPGGGRRGEAADEQSDEEPSREEVPLGRQTAARTAE
ncbi:dynamin family protein [Thiohalorhabdus methylotrophus]|uniref:Dynamin family protein n=1 Tax=Thiohalorhabdus methylotrophus TaxID=3242694 RepID=A0ABV4TXX8_9GAMM